MEELQHTYTHTHTKAKSFSVISSTHLNVTVKISHLQCHGASKLENKLFNFFKQIETSEAIKMKKKMLNEE